MPRDQIAGPLHSSGHHATVLATFLRNLTRNPALVLAAATSTLTLTACAATDGPVQTSQSGSAAATSQASTNSGTAAAPPGPVADRTALAALVTLETKSRAPTTGYSREAFGQAWTDDVSVTWGHNGCDTRNDILARDLGDITYKPGTRDCLVLTGVFPDPYSGTVIVFTRGEHTSTDVQIDHVVALSDAWQTGAQYWDQDTRTDFANDPLNLLAAAGSLNSAKGASDAASWLPPNKPFRCEYIARQIAVKAKYGLWVKAAERDAMADVLASCPGLLLPTDSDAATTTDAAEAVVMSGFHAYPVEQGDNGDTQPRLPSNGQVRYENCAAARASGAAPVYADDPGYGRHLDGDGVACE